jgi:hypothetical protein
LARDIVAYLMAFLVALVIRLRVVAHYLCIMLVEFHVGGLAEEVIVEAMFDVCCSFHDGWSKLFVGGHDDEWLGTA